VKSKTATETVRDWFEAGLLHLIGIAAMVAMHDKSYTLIVEQAENALYQSKQKNSNAVYVFDPAS
jgi:hypothetical protein